MTTRVPMNLADDACACGLVWKSQTNTVERYFEKQQHRFDCRAPSNWLVTDENRSRCECSDGVEDRNGQRLHLRFCDERVKTRAAARAFLEGLCEFEKRAMFDALKESMEP